MAAPTHRPRLSPADLEFAALVAGILARPELTAADEAFAVWCEQGALALELFARFCAPTVESKQGARHILHVEQAPVPSEWRARRLQGDAWQRAAAKNAAQISIPLEQLLAARGARRQAPNPIQARFGTFAP